MATEIADRNKQRNPYSIMMEYMCISNNTLAANDINDVHLIGNYSSEDDVRNWGEAKWSSVLTDETANLPKTRDLTSTWVIKTLLSAMTKFYG